MSNPLADSMNVASDRELVANLRILSLIARADGVVTEGERHALEEALDGLRHHGNVAGLPEDVDTLLAGEWDILVEEEFIRSPGGVDRMYQSAMAMAMVDDDPHPEELAIVDRFKAHEGEDNLLLEVLGETRDTLLPTVEPVYDHEARDGEVREDIMKFAVFSAVVGAMPVPGVAILTDIGVVALQAKLVVDIGNYWGHKLDAAAARTLIGSMAGSIGLRIAVANLARFVPGWGSVFGAVSAFASTIAVGEAAHWYFSTGGAATPADLRARYKAAFSVGKAKYEEHRDTIAKAEQAHGESIRDLGAKVAKGDATAADFENKVGELPRKGE